MSMRRFFWNGSHADGMVTIDGTEAHHMSSVLRLEVGDKVILCDGIGHDFEATVEQVAAKFVLLQLGASVPVTHEPKLDCSLFLAYTKGERLDFAVQKSVEIGANRIYLFESSRCITQFRQSKVDRVARIALEACKQSGRSRVVTVTHVGDFGAALMHTRKVGLKVFCFEEETTSVRQGLFPLPTSVNIMCGPEGGFTKEEAVFAQKTGWRSVSLGPRILRAETAPLVALTVLLYQAQDI